MTMKSVSPHPLTMSNPPPIKSPQRQAVKDPKWVEAMKKEVQALEENGTWRPEELPEGKRAIDSKWVYKIQYKPNGEIERYKARLMAKGFSQTEGIDFHETFAPVAKLVTVRTLLAVAVKKGWHIHQLDVNNAFLDGDLHEDVYMKIPQGFVRQNDQCVCKLKKSLYGLKQASRNWYKKFTKSLLEIGFRQTGVDHSLFLLKTDEVFMAALIYVDDVILVWNNMEEMQNVKSFLDKRFSIKDLGVLKFFLGIEVARTKKGLVLSQHKYILDILEDTGMTGCRPSQFPMKQNLKLDKCNKEAQVDANQYRRLIGRLLYLQATRPDVAYVVNIFSKFVGDPRVSHLEAANRVLRYLKGTPRQRILLPKLGGTNLITYCDSDWLGCPFTRRSRTGYLLLLGGAPISWKSKEQSVVSRSSAEAEYRAMAAVISEMRRLLKELDIPQEGPTQLFCNNQAARHIANNLVFHERTKHVEMD
ncbi:putative RNA-directed DNA polymerase [Helianthus annuus]|nr:putative RNA-directed DNA polymerase [Helianthus annuus]